MKEPVPNEKPRGEKQPPPPGTHRSTLPIGRSEPASSSDKEEGSLDLEVDDIPSRLPYGSEDIADK